MKSYLNRDYVENFIRYHKKMIIKVAAGFILFAAAFFVFCIRDYKGDNDEFKLINNADGRIQNQKQIEETVTSNAIGEKKVEKNKPEKIYVDITGAVEIPYVYEMKEGARVYEVIEIAGGLKDDADISNLNLAQIVKDEDKITVFTKDQIANGTAEQPMQNSKSSVVTNADKNHNQQNELNPDSEGLININAATSAELQTIKGIGPSTAEKIISYKQEHGQFKKIEEIMNVSGIGEKTFAKFKSKITV
ncbi:helix-hairpin-helix domain-containing protein [Aminipila sp.]|uniref:helix-hairpin-helix domain-containing protein n=1 Tax=Aminipila sp. TaxID=2060095 RepID=UPI00289F1401|nr:helix-hairpin-helix domain-containing protein [Aminipila sp.]